MLKKFFDHKVWVLLAACLAVLMLVVLAAGLGNIHFLPGRPLAQVPASTFQISIEKVAEEIANIPLWRQVVFWALVLVLVIIVTSLFPPEWRKKILKYFLRYSLFVLAILFLMKNFRSLLPALKIGNAAALEGNVPTSVETAPAVFTPPQIPAALLYLISLGVILALAVMAFLLGHGWLQKKRLQKDSQSLEDLGEIARSSLADISSGREWEDVIINCYARMSEVADVQRGLHRRKDLTASEFAARLEGAGLPGQAVRRLTRLFEAARYGARHASPEEVAEAVACLRTVLQACGVNE